MRISWSYRSRELLVETRHAEPPLMFHRLHNMPLQVAFSFATPSQFPSGTVGFPPQKVSIRVGESSCSFA
ncbi:hypothetical protein CC2G_014810 [Coprinopsis cinerea AmutBmut pab1-1]|nr:hypothetical protein CC2G_014810 [Coprinopsis cinerea AmutBmut pab1-1]